MGALQTAATGMYAQQLYVDIIAHNLANVNTTGYKRSKIEFQDLLYRTVQPAGMVTEEWVEVPTEFQIGYGTKPVATPKVFIQGAVTPTDNPLDLAIEGDGFFQIIRPDGTVVYTRDGNFKLSPEGRIVTSQGFGLEPDITLPADATDINIGADGTVSVLVVGSREPEVLGQIELAKFINPAGLRSIGGNLYEATVASGEPIIGTPGSEGFGNLAQGFLEASNVEVVEEMVNMIVAQRAYELNAKVIKTADQMLSIANNLPR